MRLKNSTNILDKEGEKVAAAMARGITNRRKSRDSFSLMETRYRKIFDTAKDGILILDADTGRIIDVNPFLIDLLNSTKEKILDKELWELGFFKDIAADKDGVIQLREKEFVRYDNLQIETTEGRKINVEFVSNVYYVNARKFIQCNIWDITERKKIEVLLKESEERYRSFFENSMDGIILTRPDGKIISANQAACKKLGYTENELINSGTYGIVDTSDPQLSFLLKEREAKGKARGELTFIRKNGTRFPCEISFAIFKNHENIECTSMIIRDISERKEIQNKIKFQAELLNNVGQAVIATDLLGKIIYWNHAAENIYGWSTREAMGKNIINLMPAEQTQEQALEIMSQLIAGNSWSGEFLVKRKDGSSFVSYITDTPIHDSNGNLIGVIGISSDITEKKLAEDKIILLARALESINECVSITDIDDNIIFVNKSFLKKYGYEENEVLGKNMNLVRSEKNPHELTKEILPSTLRGGWHGELWNKSKDGSEFQVYLSTTSIYNNKNKLLGLIGVAKDVTEFKLKEQELIKAKENAEQSNKLKSEFLAQMSHEIRTPLNAILGNVEYLYDIINDKMDSNVTNSFESIEIASKRIIRTVDLILNAAELRTIGYKPDFIFVDLDSEILKKLFKEHQLAAKHKGLELRYICETEETRIKADEYSITQIFANLIDNAIKYTTKGKIEIILKKDTTDNIIVEVKDTGIGISEEFLPKLFEPFTQEEQGYTRSYEGNGLGLALVNSYCELNNIKLEVESRKNAGSTFRIVFKNLQ